MVVGGACEFVLAAAGATDEEHERRRLGLGPKFSKEVNEVKK